MAQYVFAIAGILALGYWLAVYLGAKFYEFKEARKFASELRRKEAGKRRLPFPTALRLPYRKPLRPPRRTVAS